MTDRIALALALVILAALAADWGLNAGAASAFLFARVLRLVDWAVFWW
jgi:hypothetical protein